MEDVRIVDVVDAATFGRVPPCADPAFDHRSCDYWEDADRGSKARRSLARAAAPPPRPAPALADNPFAAAASGSAFNPFLEERDSVSASQNPFAPARPSRPGAVAPDAPSKLALLSRGLAIFGSYAKVLLVDDQPCGYTQFGPLSAYPRALRLRELYPQLPEAPLPAVITCIATTAEARGKGLAMRLVAEVCRDLGARGFSAVEAYPEIGADPDATSSANPAFWTAAGFDLVVADGRFPAFRLELD
jgi:GNAT superfamily N-acetyltransferase